jgi:hypothetical protein
MMDVFILTRISHTHFYASKTVDYLCEEEYFRCVHVFFLKKAHMKEGRYTFPSVYLFSRGSVVDHKAAFAFILPYALIKEI